MSAYVMVVSSFNALAFSLRRRYGEAGDEVENNQISI